MDPAKVHAIVESKDVHEVRSFLGLRSYYRQYIRYFVHSATSLYDLCKKRAMFIWAKKEVAFKRLKAEASKRIVLHLPDPNRDFVVHCDASDIGIGVVLMQEGRTSAHESRKLHEGEKNYSTYQKKLLAVVHALTIWKHFLLGTIVAVKSQD